MICRNRKCQKEYPDIYPRCPWCGTGSMPLPRKKMKRANGMGTVYKASGHRKCPWCAESTIDGSRIRLGYFSEKREAMKVLEDFRAKPKSNKFNVTVEDMYNEWTGAYFQNLSQAGINGYTAAWKRLSIIKDMKMRDIKAAHIQSVIAAAVVEKTDKKSKLTVTRPLSQSGKEKILQLASQLCKKAMEDDVINKNYADFVVIKKTEQKEKEIFKDYEIAKLEQDGDETSRMILMLLYSGMRINELFSLKIDHVFLSEGYMIGGEKTEAGRNRQIPIHSKIKPYISEWLLRAGEGQELLVVNESGKQISDDNWRKRQYYPKLEELQIPKKNPHCTRHTFATIARKAGAREEVLAKILGHTTFSMTDHYLHKDLEDMQKAVSLIK